MRIACVQLNGRIGAFEDNVARATQLIKSYLTAKPPDLLILPELAFTGYNFPSQEAIKPYLEPKKTGPSTKWAIETSKELKCYTIVGYPEITQQQIIHNSVSVVDPSGDVILTYRKRFLYDTDHVWGAKEGTDGFGVFQMKHPTEGKLLSVALGICMDLNPYEFKAPFDKFEFASHALQNDADLVLLPMAWLASDTGVPDEETDYSNVSYWLLRLLPLFHSCLSRPGKRFTVVAANRSGVEDDVTYAGSSSIMSIGTDFGPSQRKAALAGKPGYWRNIGAEKGPWEVHGSLKKGEEAVLVREVTV